MARCRQCGKPVEFRFIEGRPIPLHTQGGCSGVNQRPLDGGTVRSPESRCFRTKCPICGDPVFFIRHNGGSVFIDPPLGPPWDRHPCTADSPRSARSSPTPTPWIKPEALDLLSRVRGLVTGVVIEAEVGRGRRQTILTIAVADETMLVLLVRGGADYFLGRVVVLRPAKRLLYSIENVAEVFKVEEALHVPVSLRSSKFPLLSDGATTPLNSATKLAAIHRVAEARGDDNILRKFRQHGLKVKWRLRQLLRLVPILEGAEQDKVAHEVAVRILGRLKQQGDGTLALRLAESLPPTRQNQLIAWLDVYSPVVIQFRPDGAKVWLKQDHNGELNDFDLHSVSQNPFFLHPVGREDSNSGSEQEGASS